MSHRSLEPGLRSHLRRSTERGVEVGTVCSPQGSGGEALKCVRAQESQRVKARFGRARVHENGLQMMTEEAGAARRNLDWRGQKFQQVNSYTGENH
ncbi:hypothetical protein CRENBAI_006568 [Crenichthys baileyi]|uniref:Uncharacterized protein n=1 Tax=Crenichthys baileyi TaxID=28760 RepID=A0AAV9R7K0_9TELE